MLEKPSIIGASRKAIASRSDWALRIEYLSRFLKVDDIIPQRVVVQDNIENLQSLCAQCNRVKGDRPLEYLLARLVELGIAA